MFAKVFMRVCLVLGIAGAVAGCATSPLSRIDANRAEYETWPIEMKQAVLDGRVEKGMTPKMVEVAIGRPKEVISRASRRSSQEVWVYVRGGSKLPQNSGWSFGAGPVAVGGSGGGGVPAEEFEVVFEDGLVVSSNHPGSSM